MPNMECASLHLPNWLGTSVSKARSETIPASDMMLHLHRVHQGTLGREINNVYNPPSLYARQRSPTMSPPGTSAEDKPRCPIHKTRHALTDCKGFRAKTHLGEAHLLEEEWWMLSLLPAGPHASRLQDGSTL